jgi:cellulose biosynthesis protein BcsQ
VLITCWSVKGGSGTTVVAASLALVLARSSPHGALLVDLAGDGPAVLGLPEPDGPGVLSWLTADADVDIAALARLELAAGAGLSVVPAGDGDIIGGLNPARVESLAAALADDARPVVVDAGRVPHPVGSHLAGAATVSLLVVRPCYLALRRAATAPLRPSGVVLVTEPGRALGRRDVEAVLGVDVRAEIALDPTVARAVDAGLLAARLPRPLERSLRHAA